MFIITLTYKQPIEIVDQFLVAHRTYLETGYKNNCFLVSGPKNPRTGGIIISQLKDRAQLEVLLKDDPFMLNDIADYDIVEFTPVKYHPDFAVFV